jgi:hypothetical protein
MRIEGTGFRCGDMSLIARGGVLAEAGEALGVTSIARPAYRF